MSAELLSQWQQRVRDVEEQRRCTEALVEALRQKRDDIKKQRRQLESVIAAEKREMLTALDQVEAEAKALAAQCDAARERRDRVENEYMAELDAYERLHFAVRDIQDAEEQLASREDPEARLQRESQAWAEEEYALHRRIHQLQQQQVQARRAQQMQVQELEAQLADAERQLREGRSARRGEGKQSAQSAVRRGSRPATAAGSVTPAPVTAELQGTSAEEDAFVSANAGATMPTRAAPLRSCLKTPVNAAAASAPVSRCASQSLVTEQSGKRTVADNNGGGETDKPSLQVLQQMRAFSYAGPGKPASRKRVFLGESTNEQ